MKLKKFFKKIFGKGDTSKRENLPKLRKLQGIANNALLVAGWRHPLGLFTPSFRIEVNLLTRKITPDMKGDDVEKYYKEIAEWFHRILRKESIPVNMIRAAKIVISPDIGPQCTIKTEKKTYTSNI